MNSPNRSQMLHSKHGLDHMRVSHAHGKQYESGHASDGGRGCDHCEPKRYDGMATSFRPQSPGDGDGQVQQSQ
jgi:hypothetical protein